MTDQDDTTTAGADSERFKNRAQAHAWLVENGYRVARGKFYHDCAEGVVLVAPDGSLSKFRVLEYGNKLRRPPIAPDLARVDLSQEKLRLEVRRLENDVKKQEISLRAEDEEWIERVDHERRVALLLVRLVELLDYHSQRVAPELCHLAGGHLDAAGQVIDGIKAMLDEVYRDLGGAVIGEVVFGTEHKKAREAHEERVDDGIQ